MMYKWNVYKIFNNGKRAKAPLYDFNCSIDEMSDDFFDRNIKKILVQEFGSKIKQNKFSILRSDLPQDIEPKENMENKKKKLRYKVFSKYINTKEFNTTQMECILLFSGDTNWQWQWCVVQAGTTKILQSICPGQKTYEDAHEWMNQQINEL